MNNKWNSISYKVSFESLPNIDTFQLENIKSKFYFFEVYKLKAMGKQQSIEIKKAIALKLNNLQYSV